MCKFKRKIKIAQLFRLTIVSAKSKIYSPRRGYLSPSFWKQQLLHYSSASQFFADFEAHFVETQARFQQTYSGADPGFWNGGRILVIM